MANVDRKQYQLETLVQDYTVRRALQKALDGDGRLSYRDAWSIILATFDGEVTRQEISDVKAIFENSRTSDWATNSLISCFTRNPNAFLHEARNGTAPILVGIDGTGAGNDAEYREETDDSFVNRLAGNGRQNARYFRGPDWKGSGLGAAIDQAVAHIVGRLHSGVHSPILLTGYSRGATGVVCVAKQLSRRGIGVDALMMFDCVDRHLINDAEIVPENVRHVLHVVRSPKAKSRESFGNDALGYTDSTNYKMMVFVGTHGAMGGCYWKPNGQAASDLIDEGIPDGKTAITFAQDEQCSQIIWSHCQPFLRKHRFVL